jgi:hypothetical protein
LSFFPIRDVPQQGTERISPDGNQEEKGALEERIPAQEPTRKTEREKQSGSESIGQTRRPSLSKSCGQHERCEKAANRKVEEGSMMERALSGDHQTENC